MIITYIHRIGWFIGLVLLQVLILNSVHIAGYATPFLYIYFIQKSVTISILLVVIGRNLQYKKTYQINQNNGDSNASDYKFALL